MTACRARACVSGVAGAAAKVEADRILAAVAGYGDIAGRLESAERIGERRWDLELASGTRVKLAPLDIDASLVRLVALQHESPPTGAGILDRPNQIIDLTLADRIAIGIEATERNADRQHADRAQRETGRTIKAAGGKSQIGNDRHG